MREVNAFCGCVAQALAVKKSGWAMEEYVILAKTMYLEKANKPFKYKLEWKLLCQLPKFEIAAASLTPSQRRALLLDNNSTDSDGGKKPSPKSSPKKLASASRPGGKKAAKRQKHEERQKHEAPLRAAVPSTSVKEEEALERLLWAAVLKAKAQLDAIGLKLFEYSEEPDAIAYLNMKREEYLLAARVELAKKRNELDALNARPQKEKPNVFVDSDPEAEEEIPESAAQEYSDVDKATPGLYGI